MSDGERYEPLSHIENHRMILKVSLIYGGCRLSPGFKVPFVVFKAVYPCQRSFSSMLISRGGSNAMY